MSYSPGYLVQHLSLFTGFQLGLQLGWAQSIPQTRSITHKLQAFWEHLQHAVTIYKVKVNTNKMIFMVEWDFQEVGHNQPSWTDSTLMLIYIFWNKMAPYVTELYIANVFLS